MRLEHTLYYSKDSTQPQINFHELIVRENPRAASKQWDGKKLQGLQYWEQLLKIAEVLSLLTGLGFSVRETAAPSVKQIVSSNHPANERGGHPRWLPLKDETGQDHWAPCIVLVPKQMPGCLPEHSLNDAGYMIFSVQFTGVRPQRIVDRFVLPIWQGIDPSEWLTRFWTEDRGFVPPVPAVPLKPREQWHPDYDNCATFDRLLEQLQGICTSHNTNVGKDIVVAMDSTEKDCETPCIEVISQRREGRLKILVEYANQAARNGLDTHLCAYLLWVGPEYFNDDDQQWEAPSPVALAQFAETELDKLKGFESCVSSRWRGDMVKAVDKFLTENPQFTGNFAGVDKQ